MPKSRAVRPPEGTRAGAICELVSHQWPQRLHWRWLGDAWERGTTRRTPEAMHATDWRFSKVIQGHRDE